MTKEEHREYSRKHYLANKEKYAEKSKRWAKENPDKVREANHKQYLKRKAAKQNGTNG